MYDKEPPPDASFFRVLNASDSASVDVGKDGVKIATVAPLNVSTYGFSEAASTTFTLNAAAITVDTPPGRMVTLVWDGKKPFAIDEEPFTEKKKARLKLFNISDEAVSLTTDGKQTEVIKNVPAHGYGFRDVNALTLPFTVNAGEKAMLTTDKIGLHKGSASSVFYIKSGSSALYIVSEEKR